MARPKQDGLPKWKPQRSSIRKITSEDFRVRYRVLRNSSSNYIKRKDESVSFKFRGKFSCNLFKMQFGKTTRFIGVIHYGRKAQKAN